MNDDPIVHLLKRNDLVDIASGMGDTKCKTQVLQLTSDDNVVAIAWRLLMGWDCVRSYDGAVNVMSAVAMYSPLAELCMHVFILTNDKASDLKIKRSTAYLSHTAIHAKDDVIRDMAMYYMYRCPCIGNDEYLIRAANGDNFIAKVALAHRYFSEQNYRMALSTLQPAIDESIPSAQMLMARYQSFLGKHEEAFERYTIASKYGHVQSMCKVTEMITQGKGTSQNQELAYSLFCNVCDASEPPIVSALYGKAYHLELGLGVHRDRSGAVELYRDAAIRGHAKSMYRLGHLYYGGFGIRQNYETAYNLLRGAATAGVTGAFVTLAHMYEYGNGVAVDTDVSFELLTNAARQGNTKAIRYMVERERSVAVVLATMKT